MVKEAGISNNTNSKKNEHIPNPHFLYLSKLVSNKCYLNWTKIIILNN